MLNSLLHPKQDQKYIVTKSFIPYNKTFITIVGLNHY